MLEPRIAEYKLRMPKTTRATGRGDPKYRRICEKWPISNFLIRTCSPRNVVTPEIPIAQLALQRSIAYVRRAPLDEAR